MSKKWRKSGGRATPTEARSLLSKLFNQAVNEGLLPGQDLHPRVLDREPRRAVDFGEGLQPPALRRPFELEVVRPQGRGIERALDRVGCDDLVARLRDRAEAGYFGRTFDRRAAELLAEFADGAGERVFAFVVLALGDRPGSI